MLPSANGTRERPELIGPSETHRVSQQQLFWFTAVSLLCHASSKCKPSLLEHTPFSLKKKINKNLTKLFSEPLCEVTQLVCDLTDLTVTLTIHNGFSFKKKSI